MSKKFKVIHGYTATACLVGTNLNETTTGATAPTETSLANDKRSVSSMNFPRQTSQDNLSIAITLSSRMDNLSMKGQKNVATGARPKQRITEQELESARKSLRSVIGGESLAMC